ncbi:MAG: flagellin FliC [Bacteriovoracaceae bacterium]|mgnify:FL=1|jgi:flagellin|nr:flagellin FliC [Bacteriovoracaceae bacterium]
MGLRIATNVASEFVQTNLKKVSRNSEESLNKLSSGKRITKASDDAAGLAIAKTLESQTKSVRMATQNANNAISVVQTAEGGLGEISNIMTRLRELTIQSASDTVSDNERGFINKEYQQLLQEQDRIAQTTEFSGINLLNGEGPAEMDFQVGVHGSENSRITFDSSESNASVDNLGVSGTSVESKDDARSSIENIDEAMNSVSGFRATLGSVQSRLQITVSNLESTAANQEASRSKIEDADVALESSKLASAQVVKAAGISTLSQANNIPSSAIRLIG